MKNLLFALVIGLMWACFSCAPKVTPVASVKDSTATLEAYKTLSLDTSKIVITERITTETETPGDTLLSAFNLDALGLGLPVVYETPDFEQIVRLDNGKLSVLTTVKAKKIKQTVERTNVQQTAKINQVNTVITKTETHESKTPTPPAPIGGLKALLMLFCAEFAHFMLIVLLLLVILYRRKIPGYLKNWIYSVFSK